MITNQTHRPTFSGDYSLQGFSTKKEANDFVQNLEIDIKQPTLASHTEEKRGNIRLSILVNDEFNLAIKNRFKEKKQQNNSLQMTCITQNTDRILQGYGQGILSCGLSYAEEIRELFDDTLLILLTGKALKDATRVEIKTAYDTLVDLCKEFFGDNFNGARRVRDLSSTEKQKEMLKIGAGAYKIIDWGLKE